MHHVCIDALAENVLRVLLYHEQAGTHTLTQNTRAHIHTANGNIHAAVAVAAGAAEACEHTHTYTVYTS